MLEHIIDRKTVENQLCKLADYLMLNSIDHFHFDPKNEKNEIPPCMEFLKNDLIKDQIEVAFNKSPDTYLWNAMAYISGTTISINGKIIK